ncbi:MAG: hypothetical protein HYX92_05725 [Chloroflexi bacterium]|nr:hypothetical protein [Chloroflexota bacterium]
MTDVILQNTEILGQEVIEEAHADQDGFVHVVSEPDAEVVFEEFVKRGWTDGLPIIPPTARRVRAMLAHTKRPPSEVLGQMPPSEEDITVESVAVNAVMAGCAPEYFPLALAAVEASLDPKFNLRKAVTTTVSTWPLMIVNGPIIKELSLNHGWGVLGSGFRSNATIGRVLTLCVTTVGGLRPGFGENKPTCTPLRYGLCIAEDEEASGLLPLHVELGFKRDESVVTLIELTNPMMLHFPKITFAASAVGWLSVIARPIAECAATAGAGAEIGREGTKQLLMIPPVMAQRLAQDGWSKDDVRHFLYENARVPRAEILRRRVHPSMAKDITDTSLGLRYETVPRWVRAQMMEPEHTILNEMVPVWREPEDLLIIVSGARIPACQGAFFAGHDHWQEAISRRIEG